MSRVNLTSTQYEYSVLSRNYCPSKVMLATCTVLVLYVAVYSYRYGTVQYRYCCTSTGLYGRTGTVLSTVLSTCTVRVLLVYSVRIPGTGTYVLSKAYCSY